ncbi:hypothetical protein GHT06_020808 [Daphnia sinensis]|uniref:Dipeptidase n=1 Tax=Daphnia sinensis TaxID=1820382 RepID=A0AAD5KIX4_9CRUS|nr:hypothetical protein GHT06_020808 [Daphnia sinensis]
MLYGHPRISKSVKEIRKCIKNCGKGEQKSMMAASPFLRHAIGCRIGGRFWSAYVGCTTQYKDAVYKTWEQTDVVHRMVEANPTTLEFVPSAQVCSVSTLLQLSVSEISIDALEID